MPETYTMRKSVMLELLRLKLPDPDNPDRPVTPCTRDLSRLLLNPQPLPPLPAC
jgi:hypothetical protein